jgi:hypothetical protein
MNTTATVDAPGAWYIRALQKPVTSIGFAIICLRLDFAMEPFILFPIAFIIPVAVAAWFCRPYYAYFLAVIQPSVRFSFVYLQHSPWRISESAVNATIRIVVLVLFAYLVSRTARQTRELAKRVNLLEGILPICGLCKKIRDEHNHWQPVEVYISNRSEASFSQSLCPDCLNRDYKNIRSDD